MGTRVSVRIWVSDVADGEALIDDAFAEIDRIEQLMSTYIESSRISQINRAAAEHPVAAGRELYELIETAQRFSKLTRGAFDITYESVGQYYDFRERRRPDEAAIEAALPKVDYQHIELNAEGHTVRFLEPGVKINLGGIAKGYTVERVARQLSSAGIRHGMVNAGGDTRLIGARRDEPWVVGVQNPRDDEAVAVRLPLVDEAISTSGDYERFFEEGGRRYHHIVSPATGRPVGTVRSATVIGPDAVTTDALSTAVFVLGPKAGIELIESLDGIDAVIIDRQQRMHFSDGLADPAAQ